MSLVAEGRSLISAKLCACFFHNQAWTCRPRKRGALLYKELLEFFPAKVADGGFFSRIHLTKIAYRSG